MHHTLVCSPSAIATLQKLQEALQLQRQKQQQKLLSHIQQLVAQNQQLGMQNSHGVARSNAQPNGGVDATTSASSASHVPASSPALGLMSPAALLAAASSSNVIAQQLMSLTSSASQAHTSVANTSAHALANSSELNSQTSTVATTASNALRVNTSLANELASTQASTGGAASQSPGAESAGTPLGSPDLHLPDEGQSNGVEATTPLKAPPERARCYSLGCIQFNGYLALQASVTLCPCLLVVLQTVAPARSTELALR